MKTQKNKTPLNTTRHAIERTQERANCTPKEASHMIRNAIARGKSCDEFTKDERNWLKHRATDNNKAVVYNGYCFILSERGTCITMYGLPEWFGKKRHYAGGGEKVRNVRKFSHMREDLDYEMDLVG